MSITLSAALRSFANGASREASVSRQLEAIEAAAGEGARAFLKVYANEARARAQAFDQAAAQGGKLPSYAGLTVSIKDLFDVVGDVTTSGSALLAGSTPAEKDAEAVARLKAAGFIPVGRTNMTEFAFSGLGINPHYGTPLNPYDRRSRRIPGGSSSGAAVSVADGMADVALGTDTGGSCRIPAALCGLVGFKPTASRVSMAGTMPLSSSLDSIGSIGHSVACCAAVDEVISGEPNPGAGCDVKSLRFGVPSSYVFDDVDRQTASAFERALTRLSKAGVKIEAVETPELSEIPYMNAKGGLVAREAYLFHRDWMRLHASDYDPRVLVRIRKGETQTDEDYRQVQASRSSLIGRMQVRLGGFDAIIMPTVPLIAPRIDDLSGDDEYNRVNLLMLRNCTIANTLDRCAISLPCHTDGEAPVGLMLMGENMADHKLLSTAAAIERILAND